MAQRILALCEHQLVCPRPEAAPLPFLPGRGEDREAHLRMTD